VLRIISKLLNKFAKAYEVLMGHVILVRSGCVCEGPIHLYKHVRLRATDCGKVRIGARVVIDRYADITVKYGNLRIGDDTYLGQFSVVCAQDSIEIGRDCLIAEHVTIRDQDHIFLGQKPTRASGFVTAPIRIGDNVWLGAKVTVLKGITIGDNSVIGANSVVSRNIPANSVAVGNPARVIRKIENLS
jgi:serine acetyltransferase